MTNLSVYHVPALWPSFCSTVPLCSIHPFRHILVDVKELLHMPLIFLRLGPYTISRSTSMKVTYDYRL